MKLVPSSRVGLVPDSPEFTILLAALRQQDPQSVLSLARSRTVDWNRLFLMVLYHKVHGVVFEYLRSTGVLDEVLRAGSTKLLLVNHWSQLVQENRFAYRRNRALISDVDTAFRACNIPYTMAKGGLNLIDRGCYSDHERKMYDLDLMVRRSQTSEVIEAVRTLGFVVGDYDWRNDRVNEFDQMQVRTWLLHARGLPNLVRPAGPESRLRVDVLQAQFVTRYGGTDLAAEYFIDRSSRPEGYWVVGDHLFLSQLILHVQREMTDDNFAAWSMDWNLIKFLDIHRWLECLSAGGDQIGDDLGSFLEVQQSEMGIELDVRIFGYLAALFPNSEFYRPFQLANAELQNFEACLVALGQHSEGSAAEWDSLVGGKTS